MNRITGVKNTQNGLSLMSKIIKGLK